MILFDSHCHLDDDAYKNDLDSTFQRARQAGVSGFMLVGIHENSSKRVISIAESHNDCFCSVGVHPHDSKRCTEKTFITMQDLAKHPKVHAWGEIGLDFNRMFTPQEIQEKWFIHQLEIARHLDLPVIFHERDTSGRLITILKSHPVKKGVIHCFSGSSSDLDAYLDLGLTIGITGIITIAGRGEALRKMVPRIPINRILIETDAPYLTPEPQKRKTRRNEPAFIQSTLMTLAKVRHENPEHLANVIWNNTCSLFNITRSPQTHKDVL